jgi:YD repeat-containing protein
MFRLARETARSVGHVSRFFFLFQLAVLFALLVASGSARAGGPSYVYDALGRLVVVYDTSGNAAAYHYDAVGNLLSISTSTASQFAAFTINSSASSLTIYGTDFCSNPTVAISGKRATVTSAAATTIVVAIPAGAASGSVTVTCGSTKLAAGTFTVSSNGAPAITGFSPGSGAAGTSVTISGSNFNATTTSNEVAFNIAGAQVTSASSTSVVATVPAGATSGPATLTTPYGKATSANDFFVPPPGATLDFTGQVNIGSTITATSNTPNQQMLVAFNGTAGQFASFTFTNSTFSGFPTVTIYNPDGTVLFGAQTVINGLIVAQALKQTGTYSILISEGNSTGSVAVTVYNAPPVTGTVAIGGSAVTETLTAPGQSINLTFSGTAGQSVSFTFSGISCSIVGINNPDGTTLVSPVALCSGLIPATLLPQTGTYTISISAGSNTGSIASHAYNAAPVKGTVTIGGLAVSETLTVPGQSINLSFSGTAGQSVSFSFSGLSFPLVEVYNPDGSVLFGPQTVVGSGAIGPYSLAQTGTYTIVISDSGNIGSITTQVSGS